MFSVGDKVRIKPEWCDHPEGAEKEYTVVNVNDVTKRCYIEAEVPGFSFPLQSLVAFYMIEHVKKGLDKTDILEYANEQGSKQAGADLLLLLGPDAYEGSAEEYDELMRSLTEHAEEAGTKVYRKLTLEERKKTFDNYQALCAVHSELTPFEDFDQYDLEQEKLDLVFDAETLECLG